jgi:uncharacterized repeat protein (TIGR03803 family)
MKKLYIILCLMLFSAFAFSQYTKLLDFAGNANGNNPCGDLLSDGTFLYGMTTGGGFYNAGVIFKIKPDGTGYAKLLDFTGTANGRFPNGSLISDGTFLYGMTKIGGINDKGVIFKIKPDGTGYAKLLDFVGTAYGEQPYGSLVSDGTFLYGMTAFGGTNNRGVIFKIKPDGSGYAKLLDFAGTSNGAGSYGSLISDGTFLYGMTCYGGTNDMGVIFKIKPDGTGYVKLLDFAGYANGRGPQGALISDGTFLYGLTCVGGTNDKGVIFKIKPDGSEYSKLLDFAGAANGSYPYGSLISDGTFLYGMTLNGGTNDKGIIFKIKPDGSEYSKLLDFTGASNGAGPYNSLISDGTFLYGMTSLGGTADLGTVFKYAIPGGIAENQIEKNFNIYPNPATNKIIIANNGDLQKETFISIYNVQGEQVISNTFNYQNSMDMDVSSLANGIYMVKIQTEKGLAVKKLLIQK